MLYLVATPIGNLGDITQRALEVLRTVDLIASEDTRKTGLMLKRFEIKQPQLAFHEHNERQAGERIVELLRQGGTGGGGGTGRPADRGAAAAGQIGGGFDKCRHARYLRPRLYAGAPRDRGGPGADDDPG